MWSRYFWAPVYWSDDPGGYWAKEGFAPPVGGAGIPAFGLGQKKSFSDAAELGGGSW